MNKKTFILPIMLLACGMLSCSQKQSSQPETICEAAADTTLRQFTKENLYWIREPKQYTITDSLIIIQTEPNTDLWQRTYYGFQNDNAPCCR